MKQLRITIIALVLLGGVLHSSGSLFLAPIHSLDLAIYDRLITNYPREFDTDDVVILDIDEASLAKPELGRWPWSRNVLVELFQTLFDEYEIKVLGLDIVLAEADTSSGLPVLEQLAEGPLADDEAFTQLLEEIGPSLDYDGLFEELLMSYPISLGYYFGFSEGSPAGGLPIATIFSDERESAQWFPRAVSFGSNLERFSDSATVAGHFNPLVETDGVIRRVPLFIDYEDDLYETLSLAMLRLSVGLDKDPDAIELPALSAVDVGAEGVAYRLGDSDIRLPLDLEGALFVPFRGGTGSIKYISIADLVDGRVDPVELKGKHVVVGTTAPGLLDLRATPFSAIYPGVEIHATLLAAMLEPGKALLMVPYWKQLADYVGLAGLAVVSLFVLPGLSPTVLILCLVAGIAGLAGAAGSLWLDGIYFAVGTLFIAFILLMLSQLVLGFLEEYRKKKQFTDLFGQYVPPELVKKMAEDPERYSMAGQRLQMTVLFSDVRGFTSISEQLAPSELSEFINLYLTTMTQVIRDEGGTLDKYIGDAIMAFWGAPIDAKDHAERGVVAAIKMIEALDGLANVCIERGWPAISIGIGINTGDMSVGDMGSKIRKAYTVMGDAVNLGARLEGLTRQYGVWTIVSEFTVAECPRVRFRELDKVLVKGKEQPVIIYEPVALESDLDDEAKRELEWWDDLLEGYRGQQFEQVKKSLDQMIAEFGDRPLYGWLRGVCDEYITNPPPKDWNGVTKFTTK